MANENTDLRCYLTHLGIAAENNAIALGRKLGVAQMVFGSGVLPDASDPRDQESMIQEEQAFPCAMVTYEGDPTLLTFKADIPADVGGFNINEVGIRLEDGTIYGYARGTGDYKPTLEQGATESIRYVVDMYTANVSTLVSKIDLSGVYADYEDIEKTKEYSDNKDAEHVDDENPHTQYLTRADWLKHMLFKGMPMSAVGPDPDPDIWLPAGRVELLRADYPTVFEIVNASDFFTDQATINANPRAYAGHWGTGNGTTTFTTDDWALMMHIKVAGGYGAAGSTKEDSLQNMTGSIFVVKATGGGSLISQNGQGVLSEATSGTVATITTTGTTTGSAGILFDASKVARTDNITDTMGLFLSHKRCIPKGVFSYA